jgi:glycosyltransferase involved in cell wall biosynthesis
LRRILFLIARFEFGGAERQLGYLLRGLDKTKYDIHLGLLYDEGKTPFHEIDGITITNFHKRGSSDPGVYFRIAGYMRKNKIDIVQTFLGNHHAWIAALLAGRVKPCGGIRCTFDEEFGLKERVIRFYIPGALSRIKPIKLISNSTLGRDIYVRHGYPAKHVLVIPNGIEAERFATGDGKRIRKEFNLAKNLVIGCIGRMAEEKNHESLLRIFAKIAPDVPDARLLLVGDGPLKAHLIDLARELGIDKRLIMTGNRKDIPDLLHAMDIFAFPSRSEAWPNALGEAMAAGLPAISYRTGDVDRIIENGKDGIVTDQDIDLFVKELRKVIADTTLRKTLGSNAKKRVMEEFTVAKLVERYDALYTGL